MKNLKLVATILFLAALAACETDKLNPSSNITIQDRTIEDYTGIEISTVFTVDVTISDTEDKIEIEANDNLHAYIDVYKSGNDLVIKVKDNTSIEGKATLKAHITTTNPLQKLAVSDASQLYMTNNLSTNSILLVVDDASSMIANIDASSTEIRLDDASDLSISGTTVDLDLYAYDASNLDGLNFIVDDLYCRMEGAANVKLTVNSTIDVAAKEASTLTYRGDAVINNIDMQDASQVIKID